MSQNLLAYDKTLASYWPAFAQNGKDSVTLRDILTHESGLFNIVSITEHAKDMLDWQLMLSNVEQMALNSQLIRIVQVVVQLIKILLIINQNQRGFQCGFQARLIVPWYQAGYWVG